MNREAHFQSIANKLAERLSTPDSTIEDDDDDDEPESEREYGLQVNNLSDEEVELLNTEDGLSEFEEWFNSTHDSYASNSDLDRNGVFYVEITIQNPSQW